MKAIVSSEGHCHLRKACILLVMVALIAGMVGCEESPTVRYDLVISSAAGGEVTVPGEGVQGPYDAGTEVSLVASPDDGYEFVNWTGDVDTVVDETARSTTIIMHGDYEITANFEETPPLQYDLTISSTTGGEVTTPGEGTFAYDEGTLIDLVAEAYEGYEFVDWTGDVDTVADVNAGSTTITMYGDYSITANFEHEEVHFADPNLEAVVREAIGVPEGPIYPADMEGLGVLDARERSIQDLAGLEHCTGLIYLNAASNEISDISPLANLTWLFSLRLNENQIGDISPLANLTNLNRLRLDSNQISDISPLANLARLTELGLDSNQISDISPLAGLTNLRTLGLYKNQISDISPLANLTSLQRLYLYNNQISDISPLAGLTSLEQLYLDDNQISDISPLVDNPGLGEGDRIDLRWNPLSEQSINEYIPELIARGVTVDY